MTERLRLKRERTNPEPIRSGYDASPSVTTPHSLSSSTSSGAHGALADRVQGPEGGLRIVQVTSANRLVYGAMMSLVTLSDALRDAGHQVEFVTWRGRGFGAAIRARGYEIRPVRVTTKIDPLSIIRIAQLLRSARADVVHTHLSTSTVNGTLAGRLARVPSVATVHGMSGKGSYLWADRLIAVSNGVRDHMAAQGLDGRKIAVVYNGVPTPETTLTREAARIEFGLSNEHQVVGTVARTVRIKGYDDLLDAFAQVARERPNARFLIVGDGEDGAFYRDRARVLGLGDRIVWTGYLQNVATALLAMDAFAFASHKEAMGVAVVEAMATGLPVASTNVGGLSEVVGDAGWLVPPHAPAALTEAIFAAMNNPARGFEGKDRAARLFGVEAMRDATLDVYRSLIDATRR